MIIYVEEDKLHRKHKVLTAYDDMIADIPLWKKLWEKKRRSKLML